LSTLKLLLLQSWRVLLAWSSTRRRWSTSHFASCRERLAYWCWPFRLCHSLGKVNTNVGLKKIVEGAYLIHLGSANAVLLDGGSREEEFWPREKSAPVGSKHLRIDVDANDLGHQGTESVLEFRHRFMCLFQRGRGRKTLLQRHDPTVIDRKNVADC
jgi:hypothetical protein